jgi:hypothetical protein
MTIESPGSLIEFANRRGLTIDGARCDYSRALAELRASIANELHISEDALHEGELPKAAGRLLVAAENLVTDRPYNKNELVVNNND